MPLPIATIDKLAFGGNGVCRIEGKVCFVPYSCPGDELSLLITAKKKSYCIASIAEIITPSPFRTAPKCPVFGRCGGCGWQHIMYPTQLLQKRDILTETLWRGARVEADLVEKVVAAESQYGYRSRFQFKVAVENGSLLIGFYRQASHQVENVMDGCPLAVPVINQVLGSCRGMLGSSPDVARISQLTVDAGSHGVIVIIHHTDTLSVAGRRYFLDRAPDLGACSGLFLKGNTRSGLELLWGSPEISYCMQQSRPDLQPLLLGYSPGGFAQVNQRQNSAMLSVIRRLGSFTASERLLDLYCGNGNFSLPLAADVGSVTGIEGSADSIKAAEINKDFNKVANARFFCDDVASAVRRLVIEKQSFDVVLLDPPRTGAGDAVTDIAELHPDKIIYVSCDPSTLARDCGLLAGCGYRVITSVPIDMFPQTFHIESVTLLCRERGAL